MNTNEEVIEMNNKDIGLTGYSEKDVNKHLKQSKKGVSPCCFLCRRSDKDESFYFRYEEPWFAHIRLECIEVKRGGLTFKYLLCQECSMLLSSFVEKMDFPQRLFFSQSRN